jgi:dihydrofolate synthase/folylpolyglutamate synthase
VSERPPADEVLARYRTLEDELQRLTASQQFSASINMKLERISHLMRLLGDPQEDLPAIHITGTSGKTSTTTMAAAVLTAAGYRTGLFVSPHLQVVNERFLLDGRLAPTSMLAGVWERVKPAVAEVERENPFGRPSYFEAQVAMAFCLFQEQQVDAAVIEVGLGGTLDATNLVPARVAVLTSVGLDHTAVLGDTVEQIGRDKAGIIKPGQIVVSGVSQESVREIVAGRCAAQGATLWQRGAQFDAAEHPDGGLSVALPGARYDGLRVGMPGAFQAANAACAVAAVHAFSGGLDPRAVRAGLAQARVPGRMEVVQERPLVIIDGAHNPDKMRAAAAALQAAHGARRRVVVLALKSDKDYREVLGVALQGAAAAVLTRFHVSGPWACFPPETLAEAARELFPGLPLQTSPEPLQAVELALQGAGPDDLVWITGSLYLLGNVRERWHPSERLILDAEVRIKN